MTTTEVPVVYGRHFQHVQPDTPLTEREQAVLELVSHGCTNVVVGARLYVSEDVVKLCLRAVFIRLGAHDRAHAVRRGFELGLLTPDAES